jgi:hypothetical protein
VNNIDYGMEQQNTCPNQPSVCSVTHLERVLVGCGPQAQPRGCLDGGCGGFDVFLAKDGLGITIGILVGLRRVFGSIGHCIVLFCLATTPGRAA